MEIRLRNITWIAKLLTDKSIHSTKNNSPSEGIDKICSVLCQQWFADMCFSLFLYHSSLPAFKFWFCHSVSLGTLLNRFVPQFFHLYNRVWNNTCYMEELDNIFKILLEHCHIAVFTEIQIIANLKKKVSNYLNFCSPVSSFSCYFFFPESEKESTPVTASGGGTERKS